MPTDAFFWHPSLTSQIGQSSATSTLLRDLREGAAAGYESRDVFITSLPELFCENIDRHDAATLYEEWLKAEITIGCKPKRGSRQSAYWEDWAY